jgi:hypothetical protein
MLNDVSSDQSTAHRGDNLLRHRLRRHLLRKIWLPRGVYTALPYAYIALGAYAIFAALFLTGWNWVVPYLLLLGLICLHAGITVFAMRRRAKNQSGQAGQNLRE